jgi:hypothetical protein
MALLHRVASGRVSEPPASAISPVLVRMLDADPARRPAMHDVARSLGDVASGRTVAFEPASAQTRVLPAAGATEAMRPNGAARAEPEAATPARAPLPRESTPRPRPAPVPARHDDRRRSGAWLLAVLVALVLVAGAVAFLMSRTGDSPGGTAAPPSSAAASSSKPTPSRTSAPPTRTATAPTTRTAPPASTAPTAPTAPTVPAATGQELERAVRDYYALLPDDRDAGWERLTQRYRETTAKNRETYDAFWGAVDKVSTRQVRGAAPDSVTATVRYDFRDGRRIEEVTTFTLVREGDALLIDSSKVESSRSV